MSTNWFKDVQNMHEKYGHKRVFNAMDQETLYTKLLPLRVHMLQEELDEFHEALDNEDPEEIVDALIDLTVFALGTLDALDVDGQKAWDEVMKANMNKETGVKPGRPNPFGLPDMIKPEEWEAPSHEGNHGLLSEI